MSIKSPCTQVCEIEEKSGLCRGCARSMDEIADWARLTDAARDEIMSELEDRMRTHFGSARRTQSR